MRRLILDNTHHWHHTSDIRHQTSDVWCQIKDMRHQKYDIRRLMLDIWYQTSDVWCYILFYMTVIRRLTSYNCYQAISDVWHHLSVIRYRISFVWYWTSDFRFLTSYKRKPWDGFVDLWNFWNCMFVSVRYKLIDKVNSALNTLSLGDLAEVINGHPLWCCGP